MHDPKSPHYQFDPASVGWLHRRAEQGDQIFNADLVRIIEENPGLVPDKTVRELVLRGLQNDLKAKRGRKRTTSRMMREQYIVAIYDHLLPWIQARIALQRNGRMKARGALGPAELLYDLIGKRFGMEPESVRNLISSQNKKPK